MTKLIKKISSKLAKMEMEGKKVNKPTQEDGNRNPIQFRRPFNPPQILQRERRNNEDQKVQPLFQNNLFDGGEEQEMMKRIMKYILFKNC